MPPLPEVLNFISDQTGISVGFNEADLPFQSIAFNLTSYLFIGNSHILIRDERFWQVQDAHRLSRTLIDLKVDALVSFVDVDQPQGALCVGAMLEQDQLLILMPLIHTPAGDRIYACDALTDVMQPVVMPALPSLATPMVVAAPETRGPAMSSFGPHVSEERINEDHVPMLVRRQWGAYITCFRPKDNDALWAKRFTNFRRQLIWWATKTDVSIYLNLNGWTFKEFNDFLVGDSPEMKKVLKRVVDFLYNAQDQRLINNRVKCLEHFYASEHRWGIMLDDDAVLSDEEHHNSSWRLFAEMSVNEHNYEGVDVFFPINAAKSPWGLEVNGIKDDVVVKPDNAERHRLNHVFTGNTDLKGSMFVVRNFRQSHQPVVMPDPAYTLHGEDTYFAMLAISMGYSVRRCNNIILREFTSPRDSYFGEPEARRDAMREGNLRLAEMFADKGLRMKQDPEHLLFKDDFIRHCLGGKPVSLEVPKPQ